VLWFREVKELDFPTAELAAEEVSKNINADNITELIDSLENSVS